MPYIHVSTNVPKAGVDASAAVRALSKAVSETLGKPEAYIMAQLDLEVPMLFQASDAVSNLSSVWCMCSTGSNCAYASRARSSTCAASARSAPSRTR